MFAFPFEPTVQQGGVLRCGISSGVKRFRIECYRLDGTWLHAGTLARNVRGEEGLPLSTGADVDWPVHDFQLPHAWQPGAYVAALIDEEATSSAAEPIDARSARMLFVVRGRPRNRILLKLPLFTYQAYNRADGGDACLYTGSRRVSWRRPGGGTGGTPWDIFNADVYDESSPRQTFAHWDQAFLQWLWESGVSVDLCTDLDLHRGAVPLERYALVVSCGHDEYWSDAMRERLEAFIDAGGSVAFFTGNTCYFRVLVDEAAHCIERGGTWTAQLDGSAAKLGDETRLCGATYRNGGGKWRGERPPTGYSVAQPLHWAFRGTSVERGAVFGDAERIIGYECDGVAFDRSRYEGAGVAAACNGAYETTLLAVAELAHWNVSDGSGELLGNAAATMGMLHRGGGVFFAGTVDWPRVVARDRNAIAQAVTQNVLRRLSRG